MNLYLQSILIFVSIMSFLYIITSIRKSKVKLDYTFFWIGFSLILVLISVFPKIADFGAKLTGISSPVTFILVVIIFLLLYKVFTLTLQMSKLQERIEKLTQNLALKEKGEEDGKKHNSARKK